MKKTFALLAAVLLVLSFAGAAFAIHAEIPAETQAVVAKGTIQITLGGEIRTRGWYTDNRGAAPTATADRPAGYEYGQGWVTTGIRATENLASLPSSIGGLYRLDINNDGDIADTFETNTRLNNTGGAFPAGLQSDFVANNYPQATIFRQRTASAPFTATNSGFKSAFGVIGGEHASAAWYDQRIRLAVNVDASPGVTGRIVLESDTGADDKYTWGAATGNGMNTKPGGAWSTTSQHGTEAIGILEAWIQYTGSGLFGFNSGVKVGHMPLKLSHSQFFDHTQMGNDAIVFFMDPTKELHVGLLTIKLAEGSTAISGDDTDAYVALMTYKLDPNHNIGANYTYLDNDSGSMRLQNLGLHADGKFGNFGYKAEVDFQFGDVSSGVDASGYGVYLAGNYKMAPATLRGSFAYGSGQKEDDSDVTMFQTFVGSVQNYTLIYEYLASSAASPWMGGAAGGGRGTGIANTTYFNLGVDYAATKDINLSLDGYILKASKTPSGISKNVGWEVDAKMRWMLSKNLSYQIDAGYFKPGRFYSDTADAYASVLDKDNWESYGCSNYDRKGITVVRNMLTLSF